jgi:hypothetical protein
LGPLAELVPALVMALESVLELVPGLVPEQAPEQVLELELVQAPGLVPGQHRRRSRSQLTPEQILRKFLSFSLTNLLIIGYLLEITSCNLFSEINHPLCFNLRASHL